VRQSGLDEVRPTIREHLEQRRRSICQKSWINDPRRWAIPAASTA